MQKVKITRHSGYTCAPLGFKLEHFPCGSIVDGDAARMAIADHAGAPMFDPRDEAKVVTVTETKRGKK